MDNRLKPVLKRQLLFVGASLGISLVSTYFFGFLIGFTLNIALFIAVIFYIRRKQMKALGLFGFGDEKVGGPSFTGGYRKLNYLCLLCGTKVSGKKCGKCGSHMKKPVF
ncbi:MAG: hypothetical protein WA421_19125 [Nitrososphaeraceae archaeon]|jgi:hypothetical protein